MREEALFSDAYLSDYLDRVRSHAVSAAGQLSESDLVEREDSEIAAELAEQFVVEAPQLQRDRAEFSPATETKIDVSGDPMRAIFDRSQPFYVKGERWTLNVPYTGDMRVFSLRPSTFLMTTLFGAVRDAELLVSLEFPVGREVDVEADAWSQVDRIEAMLGHARSDIDSYNARLPQDITGAVAHRRAEITARSERLASLKTPIRRGPEPDPRPATTVRRRQPRPSVRTHQVSAHPSAKAKTTLAHEYDHILGVLRRFARSMERTPQSFAKSEEGRRDALLAALETHYEGQAFAEAFNRRGRTDILIREGEQNLFICECKIWKGPENFRKALQQLLGYVTWKDSRLSLVSFVQQADLTRVISGAREALEEAESFAGWKAAGAETELRCEIRFPGDPAQRLQLAILFVHLMA